ncbi:hypothetical protein CKM354_001196500 [Cercospora kikuchii]|uniref:Uncharacterized protein n=1 Tax=Cercospora kikuchii TaxID=84275 RepID=A0A9P3CWE9_9PEZI|nr:uncharacterized protein CKM354_001196500 [Cercospora kikuchii]GIZ48922.1 hypothetical protein CKM354_001196500 [Cercospora kikuchii]
MDWTEIYPRDYEELRGRRNTQQRTEYRHVQERLMLRRTLTEPVYLLHVKLRDIDDPPVERTLRVPTTIAFH